MYKGLCYKSENSSDDRDIVLTERVGKAIDWKKDVAWQKNEGHLGTLRKYELIQKALLEDWSAKSKL